MFSLKKRPTALDKEIERVISDLEGVTPDTAEYARIAANLEVLMRARNQFPPARLSPDTTASIVANLAGILLILQHEKLDVVATKAFGLVTKTRI